MKPLQKQEEALNPLTVREYNIGGTTYIVKAAVKDGATEDSAAKVRRLIRNEIARQQTEN